ncbi:hypothetical protein NDN08_002378 [Rhodosorus marinus]|uniref:DDB1- and CUL4-associated factor 13 n=1 Tax=Rhodosorus marinus TaxID=101924 RepID=A0AAV8UUY6_9RHOD|nr:hypothetical protein NDN08_002378 [Rhodosorus marinus]
MKIKPLSRSALEWSGTIDGSGSGSGPRRTTRNRDPTLHPFERAREEQRALNAAKLGRVFAKPFVYSLEGHEDGVYCFSRSRKEISKVCSGSADGSLRIWNLASRREVATCENAHASFLRGVSVTADGERVISAGDDRAVRIWDTTNGERLSEFLGNSAFSSVDCHWSDSVFATSGATVEIWDENRSDPIQRLEWGADSVTKVRFNPVEKDILASCGTDRGIGLYDLRLQTPVRKLVMAMRSNSVAWNPMESFNFTVANEDRYLYTYDMRKLSTATCVHMDHISAVMDVDYSPTGREFVSGSYDRTIRIYGVGKGHARDVYHTRRMQRIFTVCYSGDSDFILSGSDDADIRVWKAKSNAPMKPLLPKEREALNYSNKLVQRYSSVPRVRRVARHRHVPKYIVNANKTFDIMKKSQQRKDDNVRRNTNPEKAKPRKSERKLHIVRELE